MWADFWKCIHLPPELDDSAHANFVAWERLRKYYNAVLVALTIGCALLAGIYGLSTGTVSGESFLSRLIIMAFIGGFGAIPVNLAYCVAPVVEGYCVLFGLNRGKARTFLFFAGLLVGAGLAAATSIGVMATPDDLG